MFRRDSALKKKNDDFKRMEEGSYTQEANEEKKIWSVLIIIIIIMCFNVYL